MIHQIADPTVLPGQVKESEQGLESRGRGIFVRVLVARGRVLRVGVPSPADDFLFLIRQRILNRLQDLPVRGVDGFDAAQVTAGGLLTEDFDPKTMQSRIHPGLFACGELLDIDGPCGGYNLQWAWASGRIAGRLGA